MIDELFVHLIPEEAAESKAILPCDFVSPVAGTLLTFFQIHNSSYDLRFEIAGVKIYR